MIKTGKVIQIILNNDLGKYNFNPEMKETGKDIVVLKNPEYPTGLKIFLLCFRKDKPKHTFDILMNAENTKTGDELNIDCERFMIKSPFYLKNE